MGLDETIEKKKKTYKKYKSYNWNTSQDFFRHNQGKQKRITSSPLLIIK